MTIAEILERLQASPIALSIRQPWCHHILYNGKDVENRDWRPRNPGLRFRGPVLIHASKKAELDDRADKSRPLPLGGIVGAVEIVDCVTEMRSDWFYGPIGLVLRNAVPLAFIECKGALGFFRPDLRGARLALQEAAA